jgi:hypothetical protein
MLVPRAFSAQKGADTLEALVKRDGKTCSRGAHTHPPNEALMQRQYTKTSSGGQIVLAAAPGAVLRWSHLAGLGAVPNPSQAVSVPG